MPLSLLMAHADDRMPVLDEVEGPQSEGAGAMSVEPTHLRADAEDPDNLPLQRWGVVIPEGPEGERLKQLIQPLIERRREQQGAEVQIHTIPADIPADRVAQWKKDKLESGREFNDDSPRYLTILGDLHQVPLAVQQVLATDCFAGRLCFDDDSGYESYVAKVLKWEQSPSTTGVGRPIFHTVHDGTAATTVGYRSLIAPGLQISRQALEEGRFHADQIVESGDAMPSPDQLLKAANPGVPSILFTLSHGLGPPRTGWASVQDKMARQGAMSFGREGALAGTDIANRPFLPGGIWFLLACFGGGTPAASPYYHWLTALKNAGQFRGNVEGVLSALPQPGERPFVATLPKMALANPEGPLAVMAHLDLAWTYSFQDLDTGMATNRPARFMQIVRTLLGRHRAGVGLWELMRFLTNTETELATSIDSEAMGMAPDPARRAHLWMLRQDLSGYVLLGDPAVSLPLAAPAAIPASAPATVNTATPLTAPSGSLPIPMERLEEAIAQVILGEKGVKAIAAEIGLERGVLQEYADRYQAAGRAALGG